MNSMAYRKNARRWSDRPYTERVGKALARHKRIKERRSLIYRKAMFYGAVGLVLGLLIGRP